MYKIKNNYKCAKIMKKNSCVSVFQMLFFFILPTVQMIFCKKKNRNTEKIIQNSIKIRQLIVINTPEHYYKKLYHISKKQQKYSNQ